LEILLAVSIACLTGQLSWWSDRRWLQLPNAGKVGYDSIDSDSLAERFRIYLPEPYYSRDAWPLVIFLHGSGDLGNDLNKIHDGGVVNRELPAVAIEPQCLPSFNWQPEAVSALIRSVKSLR
jgi:hypothetical protein